MTNSTLNIEIFAAPGCNKCSKAKKRVEKVLNELNLIEHFHVREVNIVEELDYAVSLSVLTTPSIAINGKLVYSSLPSESVLREILENHLNGQ